MPHTNKKAVVQIFDVVYDRAEYYRKELQLSRSKFYEDAVFIYVNNMRKWYPKMKDGEVDYIQHKGKYFKNGAKQ